MNTPNIKIIRANVIQNWVNDYTNKIIDLTLQTYIAHHDNNTVNPDSYFLKFPNSDKNRIIALPASIEANNKICGLKWIASFPQNIEAGLDRASATLILNDRETGYPIAYMEGSVISAIRTASSAVLGANYLHDKSKISDSLTVIGCGLIAYNTVYMLYKNNWHINTIKLVDTSTDRANLFIQKINKFYPNIEISNINDAISNSDLILCTTSAVVPHINNLSILKHNPTILHISLRDFSIEIINNSYNITDDTSHALKANTSLHLASIEYQNIDFIIGNIADIAQNKVQVNFDRPRIYSPFGMGILDIAIGYEIFKTVRDEEITIIDNFFPTPYVV